MSTIINYVLKHTFLTKEEAQRAASQLPPIKMGGLQVDHDARKRS
ncbi:MAG: hypothetical protein ACTSV7_13720 [Candidatus Baldrarchaeia archaeon]